MGSTDHQCAHIYSLKVNTSLKVFINSALSIVHFQ